MLHVVRVYCSWLKGVVFNIFLSASKSKETGELPTKRKELRKLRSAIYKKNRQDPAIERAAREGKC